MQLLHIACILQEAFNLKNIGDAPAEKSEHEIHTDKERQKALKKRCKKLRTRMTQRWVTIATYLCLYF